LIDDSRSFDSAIYNARLYNKKNPPDKNSPPFKLSEIFPGKGGLCITPAKEIHHIAIDNGLFLRVEISLESDCE